MASADCDYAACRREAVEQVDGWSFCGPHAREHRTLFVEDEEPMPLAVGHVPEPTRPRTSRGGVYVPVPGASVALAFDQLGWRVLPPPPEWWLEEQERLVAQDLDQDDRGWWLTDAALHALGDLHERPEEARNTAEHPPEPRTPCRPGSGPCRRRHEHASSRRVPA